MIITERKGTDLSDPVSHFQNTVAIFLYKFEACTKSSSKHQDISALFFVAVVIRDIAGGYTAFFILLHYFLFLSMCSYLHSLLYIHYIVSQ